MERSHKDTMRKQNTMQVFFVTCAFLYKLDGYRAIVVKADGRVQLLAQQQGLQSEVSRDRGGLCVANS
jgi:hypothetical protein